MMRQHMRTLELAVTVPAGHQLPSTADVRAAYKRLAALHHPDKAPPGDRAAAAERFKEVQAAYQALMEAAAR